METRRPVTRAVPYLTLACLLLSLRVDRKVNMEVVFSRRKPAIYNVKVQKTIGKKVALST